MITPNKSFHYSLFSPFFFAHDVMSFDFQGIRRDMMVTCQEIQSEKLESSFHTDWRIFLVFPEVHLRILWNILNNQLIKKKCDIIIFQFAAMYTHYACYIDYDPAYLFSMGDLMSDHLISPLISETPPKTNEMNEELAKHCNKTKVTKPKFICTFCNQDLKCKSLLERHTISVHLKENNYQCNQCDFFTALKHTFNRHMDKSQSGVGPIKCPHCDFRTETTRQLNCHQRIHKKKIWIKTFKKLLLPNQSKWWAKWLKLPSKNVDLTVSLQVFTLSMSLYWLCVFRFSICSICYRINNSCSKIPASCRVLVLSIIPHSTDLSLKKRQRMPSANMATEYWQLTRVLGIFTPFTSSPNFGFFFHPFPSFYSLSLISLFSPLYPPRQLFSHRYPPRHLL